MAEFKIHGPFKINVEKRVGGRVLKPDEFWKTGKECGALEDKTGVYVFALKPSRSQRFIPYYIGKATKGFGQETFASDKLVKYHICGVIRSKAKKKSSAAKSFSEMFKLSNE